MEGRLASCCWHSLLFPPVQVRKNNPDPVWQPIEVDIRQLCSADEQRPLKLQARGGLG